jgi:hypothetical protein
MESAQPSPPRPTFTRSEMKALRRLRSTYRRERQLFAKQEQARLDFLRWLHRTGRL